MDKFFGFIRDNPMAAVIVAGEIAFWVFIVAGLVTRYLLRRRRTSVVLLALTPVADLLVLVATVVDLSHGATATSVHGLAAVYLGFSLVFGPSMVRWADVRFAHRFASGSAPVKLPKRSRAKQRHEWREWGKCVLAAVIAAVVLLGLMLMVGVPARTDALWGWFPRLGGLVAIWFATGPFLQLLSTKDPARDGVNS
ncbi:hypothetical protein [Amycolatopsis sp. H20-H5]|uniref:hypothetical protein n=1 Tax=Amycolatopsis sp. H20-H5 TaxID=3046309 RepID=UPI002DB8AE54|nr:hypothetical protein [Amycolatopsis sp. H20-H5]MEC3974702.1 hypothetical protein [Amycolatopsis sp. H20-H5]